LAYTPKFLTIYRHDDTIIIDIVEKSPISSKSRIRIEDEFLKDIYREINRITLLANMVFYGKEKNGGQNVYEELKKIGNILYNHLLPSNVQKYLQKGESAELYLKLDDRLAYIPWELCFDGENFLTTKFLIGRQIITDQTLSETKHRRRYQDPLKLLIIIDPTESLKHAQDEAESLCSILEDKPNIEIELIGGRQANKLSLVSEMRDKDIIHFIGHAFFDEKSPERSGWILKEGILTTQELGRMETSPILVFSNACQSGATANWDTGYLFEEKVFGIGNGFLIAGVQNFIGPFWVVHDEGSVRFASNFYRGLISGESIGTSLQIAKHKALKKSELGDILWASYIHYGDPAAKIVSGEIEDLNEVKKEHKLTIFPNIQISITSNLKKMALIIGVSITIGYICFFTWHSNNSINDYSFFNDPQNTSFVKKYEYAYESYKSGSEQEALKIFKEITEDENNQLGLGYDGLAAIHFDRGELDMSRQMIRESLSNNTNNMMSHVIHGDILFTEGKRDKAIAAYYQALEIAEGLNWQKVRANNALAIAFYTNEKIKDAGSYLQKALLIEPENTNTLFNLGYLSWKSGKNDEAILFLKKVIEINRDEELARYFVEIINHKPEIIKDERAKKTLLIPLFFDGGHLINMGMGEAITWIVGKKLEEKKALRIIRNPSIEKEISSVNIGFHKLSDSVAAINIAKVAKSDYVFYGSYKNFGNTIEAKIRVVNVETKEIVTIEHQKAYGENKFNDLADILVKKIIENIEQ